MLADAQYDKLVGYATTYAVFQFYKGSSVVKGSYTYDAATPLVTSHGPYEIVSVSTDGGGNSAFCTNLSVGGEMTCRFDWRQTMATTISNSDTLGTSVKVGTGKESPVQAEFSVQYQHTWGKSTTTSDMQGFGIQIKVPAGKTAFLIRGWTTKKGVGTWTFSTDMGDTWTGKGEAIVPVAGGEEGPYGGAFMCTTDSPDSRCQEALANSGGKP
ncbi:hypothetical protein [Streptomyces sp. NPDC048637]|uniref:hypothetical protein n=1 Tax=Streptomyces sp. NPDC048637 TaxID=3155636 RepID=UPI0034128013